MLLTDTRAEATEAVVDAVATLPSLSVTVTATVYQPDATYVLVPATEKLPAEPVTTPALVLPSPHVMVAAKSLATLTRSGSVNVATVTPTAEDPSVALTATPLATSTPSFTINGNVTL